jgi:antitoxin component HigA of HigAB toxin-antitoxin module
MMLKPIKTKRDYQNALERLESIFDAKKDQQRVMNLRCSEF